MSADAALLSAVERARTPQRFVHPLIAHGDACRAAAAERAARSGLVVVQTTHEAVSGGLSADLSAANVVASSRQLAREVGAFISDATAKRMASLRGAVGWAARAHMTTEQGHRGDVAWMVTLTYAGGPEAWKPEHITKAMNAARDWCKRRGVPCRYVWVAELQKRGVIHYHAVFWLPRWLRMPKWDARGWWAHGMSNRVRARFAVGYLMKYVTKGTDFESGRFPKGARSYGVGGLDHAQRRGRRWLRLPAHVQGNSSIWDDWRREVGGGWRAPDGRLVPSEFRQVFVGGQRALIRVHRHARSIDAAGPFSWVTDREKVLAVLH